MATRIDTIALFPLSAEVAWRRYLESTRDLEGDEYDSAEREAWDVLQESLDRVPAHRPDDVA